MKSLYSLLVCALIARGAYAQIPNPSFENWADGNPTGWTTSNAAATSVTETTPAHAGSIAAKLETFTLQNFWFGGTLIANGFQQETDQEALHGWYKATLVGGDVFSAAAFINDNADQPVRAGSIDVTANTNVYTEFVVNMDEVGAGNAAVAVISLIILSSEGSTVGVNEGSSVVVDDLSWGQGGVGVEESVSRVLALESIYPNPSNGNPSIVQFNIDRNAEVVIDVLDMSGRKVMTVLNQHMGPGHYRADLHTSALAPGTYCCRMVVDGVSRTLWFVN
jgi:hypothetical protein